MSTQRNKVHHVHTDAWVARKLGVDEDLIHDLTLGMEPEDGVIWVYGVDSDDGVMAFTDEGIEEVRLILEEHKEFGRGNPSTLSRLRGVRRRDTTNLCPRIDLLIPIA